MRIGLLRHFPVELPLPSGWRTAADLFEWRVQYERSPAVVGSVDIGQHEWTRCLSSDLERALVTAKAAFPGPVESTPLLREVEFAQFKTGPLRLPMPVWRGVFGLAWATGHRSQRACRDEFRRRVVAVADLLEGVAENTLVVSHGGMMIYLSAELRRRGYPGPKLKHPRHATLYCYQKAGGIS
jgi:broad specificity phosphatase PhoE